MKTKSKKTKKPRRRHLGGVWFTCINPGYWLSEDYRFAICQMMGGSMFEEWELFRTAVATGKMTIEQAKADLGDAHFWAEDAVAQHFTMGELDREIASVSDWTKNLVNGIVKAFETQEQHRRMGFGPVKPDGTYPFLGTSTP